MVSSLSHNHQASRNRSTHIIQFFQFLVLLLVQGHVRDGNHGDGGLVLGEGGGRLVIRELSLEPITDILVGACQRLGTLLDKGESSQQRLGVLEASHVGCHVLIGQALGAAGGGDFTTCLDYHGQVGEVSQDSLVTVVLRGAEVAQRLVELVVDGQGVGSEVQLVAGNRILAYGLHNMYSFHSWRID